MTIAQCVLIVLFVSAMLMIAWAALIGRHHRSCFPSCRVCGGVGAYRTKDGFVCQECFAKLFRTFGGDLVD